MHRSLLHLDLSIQLSSSPLLREVEAGGSRKREKLVAWEAVLTHTCTVPSPPSPRRRSPT